MVIRLRMERALLVLVSVVSLMILTWQEFVQGALVAVPFVILVGLVGRNVTARALQGGNATSPPS